MQRTYFRLWQCKSSTCHRDIYRNWLLTHLHRPKKTRDWQVKSPKCVDGRLSVKVWWLMARRAAICVAGYVQALFPSSRDWRATSVWSSQILIRFMTEYRASKYSFQSEEQQTHLCRDCGTNVGISLKMGTQTNPQVHRVVAWSGTWNLKFSGLNGTSIPETRSIASPLRQQFTGICNIIWAKTHHRSCDP